MIALVSTTMCGSPAVPPRPPSGTGRRTIPIASAAMIRSSRFATVRPSIPSPRPSDTASGSHVPSGSGKAESGRPSSSPIRRPSSRPTTAVTNSAVESCSIWRISQTAGTTVRYGRIAKPTTIQATTQAIRSQPPASDCSKSRAVAARPSPTRPPSAAPRRRMLRITWSSRRPSRGVEARRHRTRRSRRTLASARPDRHATGPLRTAAQRRIDRVPEAADGDDLEARDVGCGGTARPARDDRPAEPEPGGLAQPAIQAVDRAELAEQADLPDRDGVRRDRAIAERRREGDRERQVEAGLVDRQAAGEVDVDVVAARGRSPPVARGRRPGATPGWRRRRSSSAAACRRGPARRAPGPRRAAAATPRASARRRCPAPARRARRGTPGPDRRPREGRLSPISNTPTSSVEPNRFFVARRRRTAAYRSPSRVRTASTRCSSVFGPAIEPSFVTWPTRTTAIPLGLATSIRRRAAARTWPTLPAGPSSSSTVAVWIESMTSRAGAGSSIATPAIRSMDDFGGDPDPARRTRQEPEPVRPETDLGRRFLARGVEHPLAARRPRRRRRRPGGGAWTCRSPARRRRSTTEPGTSPPPRTRSSSPIPIRRRAVRPHRHRPGGGSRRRRRSRTPPRAAALRGSGRTGRLDEAVPRLAGAALALPAEERLRRRTGRRSGSGRGRRSCSSRSGRRATGAQASTGVSGSAAWMSRPASGSRSTTIVVPGSYLPSRRCSARTSSTMFWITRRSGRAPYATS